jgi:hypothetical protein
MSLPNSAIRNILSFIGNRDIDTPLLQACKGWHVVTEEEEEENGLDYFIDLFPSRSRGFASTKKKETGCNNIGNLCRAVSPTCAVA